MNPRTRRMGGGGFAPPSSGTFDLWSKYYSTVLFQSAVTGTFTYTIASGTELRAFSYATGQTMNGVGFASTDIATFADTNLTVPFSTISGETVEIFGMSCLVTADSEPAILKQLAPQLSVAIGLNGDNHLFRMGTLEMVPGGGGIFGAGDSLVVAPPQEASFWTSGTATNGWPSVNNYLPFPDSLYWKPQGQTDGTLNVKLKAERVVTYVTLLTADRAAQAGGPNTPGTAAWTHPATGTNRTPGTFVGIKVHLQSRQSGDRSVNQ